MLRGRAPRHARRPCSEALTCENGLQNAPSFQRRHGIPVASAQSLTRQRVQINRFSLADGLAKLGYRVSDADIDHLLEQLATVPGVETSTAVSKESFAASQLDWEALQGQGDEDWQVLACVPSSRACHDGGVASLSTPRRARQP